MSETLSYDLVDRLRSNIAILEHNFANLQAENARLNQERRDDCLAGQTTMEEAYNTIERLKQRVKELESSGLCVYCGKVSHTKDGQTKLDMMIEHMAECEKHPVANLLVEIDRLKSDKRELVDALERIVAYLRTIGIGTLVTIPLGALITKHKEVAPKS